jgi:hypothetical protein
MLMEAVAHEKRTADGYLLVAQPKAGVPVRVGVDVPLRPDSSSWG